MADSGNKTDAWMPLWIGAYLADTMRLTLIQHGAYLLLLMAYWRERAPLPDDDEELRSIIKADKSEWKKLRPVLEKYFTVGGGVWHHKRVEQELASAHARQKAAAAKATKAAEARWGAHTKDEGEHSPKHVDKHVHNHAPGMPEAMLGALPEHVLEECPTPTPTPCIPPPSQNSETSVCVSGHTQISENFKNAIEPRQGLDAERVWQGFCDHYPEPKRTLARWQQWWGNERIPSPGWQGAAPPVPLVVASISAEATRAAMEAASAGTGPPPPEIRQQLKNLSAKARGKAEV